MTVVGHRLTHRLRILWPALATTRATYGKPSLCRYVSDASQPRVIFSGIQPTGVPHLGNYLGALQQWVELQNQASRSTRLLFSIVDLHAITSLQSRDELRRWKRETLAMLLAIGLDPMRSTIFYQSDVSYRCGGGAMLMLFRFLHIASSCGS